MVWNYPDLRVVPVPSVYSPALALSGDGTRLLWAEGAANSGAARIHRLDAGTTKTVESTLVGSNYFLEHMAVSRDHARFLHMHDIYDQAFQYLGGLEAPYPVPGTVGLSGNGKVAVSYDRNTHSVHAFAVGGDAGPFPTLGEVMRWTDDTAVNLLHLDDAGTAVFMFSSRPGVAADGVFSVRAIGRK
jgi:hypothetical protein